MAAVLALVASCYPTDRGLTPPAKAPYFPVGLAVSPGGKSLFVANSDFDLQYESGTIESYDLLRIREDALKLRDNPRALVDRCADASAVGCPYVHVPAADGPRCADAPGDDRTGAAVPDGAVGNVCTPPMKPESYHLDSVRIGAFATSLLLSNAGFTQNGQPKRRLYAPIRGNASVTWLDIADDARDPSAEPGKMDCGATTAGGACSLEHQAGNRADEPGNSRFLTLPGEPFGLAQSPDGAYLALTHQSAERASLLLSGLPPVGHEGEPASAPSLQYVADRVPNGGTGVAAIPYTAAAYSDPDTQLPRPAFLSTSRQVGTVSLLRVYSDEGRGNANWSTLSRPYLVSERQWPVTGTTNGADSRDVVIDDSARIECAHRAGDGASAETKLACARLPLRVFIANRSPASILVAEYGRRASSADPTVEADELRFLDTVPVPAGVARMQLAPIVEADGGLSLRLFATCFDSNAVVILDPETRRVERILRVGRGPFALAFDPFDPAAAARHEPAPRAADGSLGYRFAYLAHFTESNLQVLDLDGSDPTSPTFLRPVFTLGEPTPPKSEQD